MSPRTRALARDDGTARPVASDATGSAGHPHATRPHVTRLYATRPHMRRLYATRQRATWLYVVRPYATRPCATRPCAAGTRHEGEAR